MKKKGYVVLLNIIILVIIGTLISTHLSISGVSTAQERLAQENGMKAKNFANACAEKAINELKTNESYTGNQTINFPPNGSCQIGQILGSGNSNRTVQTIGYSQEQVQKIKILISTINPTVITSWEEVSDF